MSTRICDASHRSLMLTAVTGLLLLGCRPVCGQETAGVESPIVPGQTVVKYDPIPQPAGGNLMHYLVSPDGTRFAFAVFHDGRYTIVVDGKADPSYEETLPSKEEPYWGFSEDSRHFFYVAREGWNQFVVLDGRPGPELTEVASRPSFADDGMNVMYGARKNDGACYVIQGPEGVRYVEIPEESSGSFLTRDGRHYGYIQAALRRDERGQQQKAYVVVVDGKAGKAFEKIEELTVSEHGGGYAYVGRDTVLSSDARHSQRAWYLVVNDRTFGPYADRPANPVLSPDGNHHLFAVRRRDSVDGQERKPRGWYLIWDGREIGPWNEIHVDEAVFSPDSQHFACPAVHAGGGLCVCRDGQCIDVGPVRTVFDRLIFSPDSQRLAFVAERPDRKRIFVTDNKASEEFDDAGFFYPHFSADGTRVAYSAHLLGKEVAVVDGQKHRPEEDIRNADLSGHKVVFSPDARHFAYVAREHGRSSRWYAAVDGRHLFQISYAGKLEFNSDGRHLIVAGKNALLVDGCPAPTDSLHLVHPFHYPSQSQIACFATARLGGSWHAFRVRAEIIPAVRQLAEFVASPLEDRVLAISPDGLLVAVGGTQSIDAEGQQGAVLLFDAEQGRLVRSIQTPWEEIGSMVFSPDGRLAVCGGDSRNRCHVRIHALSEQSQPVPLDTKEGVFSATASFSPDGRRFVAALNVSDDDRTCLGIWDVSTGRLETAVEKAVWGAFARNGNVLYTAFGCPAHLRAWDVASGDGVGEWALDRAAAVLLLSWSDARASPVSLLDVARGDWAMAHWDLHGGGLSGCINSLPKKPAALSPDGRIYAWAGHYEVGESEEGVMVTDARSGRRRVLLATDAEIAHVSLSQDGRRLATLDDHSFRVRVWDLSPFLDYLDRIEAAETEPDGTPPPAEFSAKEVEWSVGQRNLWKAPPIVEEDGDEAPYEPFDCPGTDVPENVTVDYPTVIETRGAESKTSRLLVFLETWLQEERDPRIKDRIEATLERWRPPSATAASELRPATEDPAARRGAPARHWLVYTALAVVLGVVGFFFARTVSRRTSVFGGSP